MSKPLHILTLLAFLFANQAISDTPKACRNVDYSQTKTLLPIPVEEISLLDKILSIRRRLVQKRKVTERLMLRLPEYTEDFAKIDLALKKIIAEFRIWQQAVNTAHQRGYFLSYEQAAAPYSQGIIYWHEHYRNLSWDIIQPLLALYKHLMDFPPLEGPTYAQVIMAGKLIPDLNSVLMDWRESIQPTESSSLQLSPEKTLIWVKQHPRVVANTQREIIQRLYAGPVTIDHFIQLDNPPRSAINHIGNLFLKRG